MAKFNLPKWLGGGGGQHPEGSKKGPKQASDAPAKAPDDKDQIQAAMRASAEETLGGGAGDEPVVRVIRAEDQSPPLKDRPTAEGERIPPPFGQPHPADQKVERQPRDVVGEVVARVLGAAADADAAPRRSAGRSAGREIAASAPQRVRVHTSAKSIQQMLKPAEGVDDPCQQSLYELSLAIPRLSGPSCGILYALLKLAPNNPESLLEEMREVGVQEPGLIDICRHLIALREHPTTSAMQSKDFIAHAIFLLRALHPGVNVLNPHEDAERPSSVDARYSLVISATGKESDDMVVIVPSHQGCITVYAPTMEIPCEGEQDPRRWFKVEPDTSVAIGREASYQTSLFGRILPGNAAVGTRVHGLLKSLRHSRAGLTLTLTTERGLIIQERGVTNPIVVRQDGVVDRAYTYGPEPKRIDKGKYTYGVAVTHIAQDFDPRQPTQSKP